MELTTPVPTWTKSTRPLLDLSNFFHTLCIARNNDTASPQTLLELVESVLGDLTVKEMIDQDQEEFDYDGEGIWPAILQLESIAYDSPYEIPNWQLEMAVKRLERLSSLVRILYK